MTPEIDPLSSYLTKNQKYIPAIGTVLGLAAVSVAHRKIRNNGGSKDRHISDSMAPYATAGIGAAGIATLSSKLTKTPFNHGTMAAAFFGLSFGLGVMHDSKKSQDLNGVIAGSMMGVAGAAATYLIAKENLPVGLASLKGFLTRQNPVARNIAKFEQSLATWKKTSSVLEHTLNTDTAAIALAAISAPFIKKLVNSIPGIQSDSKRRQQILKDHREMGGLHHRVHNQAGSKHGRVESGLDYGLNNMATELHINGAVDTFYNTYDVLNKIK